MKYFSAVATLVLVGACSGAGSAATTEPPPDLYSLAKPAVTDQCVDAAESMLDTGRVLFTSTCSFAIVELADGGLRIGWIQGLDKSLGASRDALEAVGSATECFSSSQFARIVLTPAGTPLETVEQVSWGFEPGDDNPNTASLVIICAPQ